ncbi:MAG: NAD(P)H-dependent oxidoreductase [Pseudomonadota bacterium]
MTTRILRIDASARQEGSVSRAAADAVIERLRAQGPVTVDHLDLAETTLPAVDAGWIAANFTPEADRTDAHRAALAGSDQLVAQLKAADAVVIATPIYNFGLPAPLKAWIDQIARARLTFRYTENGPEGLLTGKRAVLAIASGGVPIDSPADFATPYLRHALGFVGIKDVAVVSAAGGDLEKARADAAQL